MQYTISLVLMILNGEIKKITHFLLAEHVLSLRLKIVGISRVWAVENAAWINQSSG